MPMPSRRKVSYVSKDASPYADSDVVVIEEDVYLRMKPNGMLSSVRSMLLVRKCLQMFLLMSRHDRDFAMDFLRLA